MSETTTETKKVESVEKHQADINGLVEAASTAAASKAVEMADKRYKELTNTRLNDAAAVLKGETKESPDQKLLGELITSPTKVFGGLINLIRDDVRKDINIENAQKDERKSVVDGVSKKYLSEYPALNNSRKIAMVEGIMERNLRAGKSNAEALEAGFKETVEELKLSPASATPPVGMPIGGYRPNPTIDLDKSARDFYSGSRNRLHAARNVATKRNND